MKNLSIPISDKDNVAITDIDRYSTSIIIAYNDSNVPVGYIIQLDAEWMFCNTIFPYDSSCTDYTLVDLIKRFSEYNFKVIEFTEQCTI